MHSSDKVKQVFELAEQGFTKPQIARESGVSRSQIRDWLRAGMETVLNSPMRIAQPNPYTIPTLATR